MTTTGALFSRLAYKNEALADLPKEYYNHLDMLPDSMRIAAQHRYGLYAEEIKVRNPAFSVSDVQNKEYLSRYWEHYVLTLNKTLQSLDYLVDKAYASPSRKLDLEISRQMLWLDTYLVTEPFPEANEAEFHADADAVDHVKMELYAKGWAPSSTLTNYAEFREASTRGTLEKHVKMVILLKCSFV